MDVVEAERFFVSATSVLRQFEWMVSRWVASKTTSINLLSPSLHFATKLLHHPALAGGALTPQPWDWALGTLLQLTRCQETSSRMARGR